MKSDLPERLKVHSPASAILVDVVFRCGSRCSPDDCPARVVSRLAIHGSTENAKPPCFATQLRLNNRLEAATTSAKNNIIQNHFRS